MTMSTSGGSAKNTVVLKPGDPVDASLAANIPTNPKSGALHPIIVAGTFEGSSLISPVGFRFEVDDFMMFDGVLGKWKARLGSNDIINETFPTNWAGDIDNAPSRDNLKTKIDLMDTATGLNTTHAGLSNNPHSVTAAQAGADPVGSASSAQTAAETFATNADNAKTTKDAVVTAFTTNISLTGEKTNDGVTTLLSEVVVTGNTNQIENGPYITATGAWTRRSDLAAGADGHSASFLVTEGTSNKGKIYFVDVVQGTAAIVGADNLTFDFISGGGSSELPWEIRSATGADLVNGSRIAADTSGGTFTLNLPSSPSADDECTFIDYAKSWGSFTLTLGRNGENIEGDALDFDLNVSKPKITFTYIDATKGWVS